MKKMFVLSYERDEGMKVSIGILGKKRLTGPVGQKRRSGYEKI